jgi:hypothetical protein
MLLVEDWSPRPDAPSWRALNRMRATTRLVVVRNVIGTGADAIDRASDDS